jgi:hypothetical protein
MKVWRPQTAYALKQGPSWETLLGEIASCLTVEAVWAWWADYLLRRHRDYPEGWSLALRDACEVREGDLLAGRHHAELDAAYAATVGR